ncbi:transcription antitermination factor NusB [Tyzzerella sp. An114]|uniref:transcription antitermination factor NusB n=1 Tax=Tyzzerella sp. An114 TaxID=1965545 RepID=UPI000B4378BF|nr:transcription antitermination factor NusB [Tyzzerella sp. An114]OUQ59901.1 transcription antitermination factor NusB [Tyzzerella sp. An114]
MRRRDVRRNAFTLLFQLGFTDNEEEAKNIFFEEAEMDLSKNEKEFILKTVNGVREHVDEIDEIINSVARKWDTKRMANVDLAILRLAVYEMRFDDETPDGVVINEAVELAKEYSSDGAPSFVNGILGKLV